jgi:hypothetical protein
MNGLEIFLIVGILSIITFYFISRTLLNKKYKKFTYLTPAIAVTVASLIFLVLTFILSKDGWVIMGNYFFVIVIVSGALIGTFLPFIHSKYRQ